MTAHKLWQLYQIMASIKLWKFSNHGISQIMIVLRLCLHWNYGNSQIEAVLKLRQVSNYSSSQIMAALKLCQLSNYGGFQIMSSLELWQFFNYGSSQIMAAVNCLVTNSDLFWFCRNCRRRRGSPSWRRLQLPSSRKPTRASWKIKSFRVTRWRCRTSSSIWSTCSTFWITPR